MDTATKERLKNIPRTRCNKCNTPISYENPMARCADCGKKFCYDHINGSQAIKSMGENDEVIDLCDICKKALGGQNLV